MGPVGVEGDGGVHRCVGVSGELGVIGPRDGVGPRRDLGAVLDGYAQQFRNRKSREDGGDLGHPVECAACDDVGQDVPDGMSVAGLKLGDGPRGEPTVHQPAEAGVLRPVGLDDRAEQVTLLIDLGVEEHAAALRREPFDVPVGRLHVGMARQGPEPGYGRIVRFVPEHRRLTTQPRELVMRDAPGPLVLADEIDVHRCSLSLCPGRSALDPVV